MEFWIRMLGVGPLGVVVIMGVSIALEYVKQYLGLEDDADETLGCILYIAILAFSGFALWKVILPAGN